jgi:hypothetical protein
VAPGVVGGCAAASGVSSVGGAVGRRWNRVGLCAAQAFADYDRRWRRGGTNKSEVMNGSRSDVPSARVISEC